MRIDIDRDELDRVLAEKPAGWLSQTDVARLLGAAGIVVAPSRLAHSPEEAAVAAAEFDRPVAIKVAEPAILHKSDVGGVLLNVEPDKAMASYTRLAERLSAHGVALAAASVTPMVPRGVEVIAGITNDPVFGPLVAFGSGGVLVELLDDVVFRVLPMTDRDAATMIRETRAFRLLQGFRGSAPADVAALEHLLLALGALAEAAPRIAEVDLNPVVVHQEGAGVSLIDARVRLSEYEAEVARMAPLRLFPHSPRSVAQFHAEFSSWEPVILGKMTYSSMAFKLHSAPAYEKSNSTIAN